MRFRSMRDEVQRRAAVARRLAREKRKASGPKESEWLHVLKSRTHITESGCWEGKYHNSAGYAIVWAERGSGIMGLAQSAHVIAYEWDKGVIPQGLQVDHTCNNPRCFNPDHLDAVTPQENIRRRDIRNGRRTDAEGDYGYSFFHTARGLWVGSVEIGEPGGARKRRRVSSKDRDTAWRKLETLRREVNGDG